MSRLPFRHPMPDVRLDLLRHLLEESGGRPAASRTGGDLRLEAAKPERLKDLLRHANFFRAISARARRQRDADGVSDTLSEKDRHRSGARDDTLRSHASLGQTQVQRA